MFYIFFANCSDTLGAVSDEITIILLQYFDVTSIIVVWYTMVLFVIQTQLNFVISMFSGLPAQLTASSGESKWSYLQRDFRLIKTVDESTCKQCLEHCSGFSTFGISLSRKKWQGHKAVLDSDPRQWPGQHCCQWQYWQQCLSRRTRAVLTNAQALYASACHC